MVYRSFLPLLSLIGSLVLLPMAHAATYYVAPSGQSGCSQDPKAPQGGITNALGCLHGGDTLMITDGQYDETVNMGAVANGTAGSPTTIKAATLHGAVLTSRSGGIQFGGGNQGLTVDGLVIDGGNTCCWKGTVKMAGDGIADVLIANVEIRNMTSDDFTPEGGHFATTAAMFLGADVRNVVIRHAYIHDIGMNCQPFGGGACCNECEGYGAYVSGGGYTIENSTFTNLSGFAIHGYPSMHNSTLRGNYWANTGGGLLACGSDNTITNNVLNRAGVGWGSGHFGIRINWFCAGNPSTGTVVATNTICESKGTCIELGRATNGTIRDNICWHNGADSIDPMSSSNMTIEHNQLGGQAPSCSAPAPVAGGGQPSAPAQTELLPAPTNLRLLRAGGR